MKKFANNKFDVPDFMHVQGLYETKMQNEAFNTVDEYAEITSERAKTQMGKSVFGEEKQKVKNDATPSEVLKTKFFKYWFPVYYHTRTTGTTV